jgi:DNA-binding NtrC family response regulator/PAS domain-containing protein
MLRDPDAEILRLRAALRDLVALSTIPAAWVGSEPSAIAAGLADVLAGSLYLDFTFVRLCDPRGGAPIEMTRGNAWKAFPEWLQRHLAVVGQLARKEIVPDLGGAEPSRGMVIPIGINAEGGLVAAASNRTDFPTEIDQLLLSVAANHAATAFQSARLEQELRQARTELEIKVAERTAELRRAATYLAEAQRLSHTGSFGWMVSSGEIFWSEETFRIFECDPATKPTVELMLQRVHPEDNALVQQLLDRASRDGQDFDLEHRLLMPDGSIKYVHVVSHGVRDDLGYLEFVGSVMDVTAAKRAYREIQALQDQLQKENIVLREEIDNASMFEEIVGASPVLQHVLARIAKVAPTDSTVLITGETGTGKELIARAIHKRSPRSARAFVNVNCAATPPSLIASGLFGHEKGAFTGALQRRLGRFELAEGGTIFLDEIGELPAETQIALLRVLQEREFERVGGTHTIRADVRVIAATNRDLNAAMAAGTFRRDLYYRLNVFPIESPPLRVRQDDILLLMEYFIDRYASKAGKKIRGVTKKTLELLQAYSWPGNIRELQNVIERSVILCETENFSIDESWLSRETPPTGPASQPLSEQLVIHEKDMIEAALAEASGRVSGPSGAAAKLGLPPSTLESKIRSLKIRKHRFKPI